MFLRGDVTEHRAAVPADHRGADAGRNVVIARSDIRGQRPQRIEGRFLAFLQLLLHVLLNQMHRHMAWTFDHHLDVMLPGDLGQFAQRFEFGKLRFIVGIGDRAGSQAVAQAEGHVIGFHDLADLFEMRVERSFPDDATGTIWHDRPAAGDDAGHALAPSAERSAAARRHEW